MKNLITKFSNVLYTFWKLIEAIILLVFGIFIELYRLIIVFCKWGIEMYKKSDKNKLFIRTSLGSLCILFLSAVYIISASFLGKKGDKNNIDEKVISKKEVIFGIDISQYQGDINWATLEKQEKHPIKFIIIRATMGDNRKDIKFDYNFKQSKDAGFITGAYHYYDPNENSSLQAANFIKNVKLTSGNFYPVLDIERMPKKSVQSMKKMKTGLQNWLNLVEAEYGVKPIIYTGLSYWNDYLKKDFGEYSLWVAAYSANKRNHQIVKGASIHQFAESINVPGIKRYTVDGNDIPTNKLATLVFK